MMEKIQRKFALSPQGAKDLIKSIICCTLQNIVLMFPVCLLYLLVQDLMNGGVSGTKTGFYIAGIVVCLALICAVTYFQYNAAFLATYVESGVRRIHLSEKLRKIPLSFFGEKDLSDLTSTMMADCATLETAFSHFIPELVGSMISTVLIALSLLFFEWHMALAALWVIPVAFIIIAASSKVQDHLSQKSMQAKMACADGIQEYIETLQDLKANNAEKEYLNGLEQKVRAVEQRSIVSEFGTAAFVVSANMILKLGIATVALVGAILLSKGTIDVLTFFLFLLVASRLYDPLQGALQNLAAIISTRTNVARMNEILDHPTQQGADVLSNQGCDITFSHVGFAYDNGETILKDISFTAKQGAVTALVGPSGSGKTTVSRLAARFWDTKQGTITVGGMDISKVDPETLMTLYSIVGKKGATDEEVLRAAKLANCDEFAEKLPNGYQTMIGENGSALSGGERQRISIARAFLKDAPIILLDEATASLDVENETLIQTALSRLIANKTVLMIAHRMRTVANADKILVLKDGTIVESGTPEELMQKQNGLFRHMTELQKQSSVWEVGK